MHVHVQNRTFASATSQRGPGKRLKSALLLSSLPDCVRACAHDVYTSHIHFASLIVSTIDDPNTSFGGGVPNDSGEISICGLSFSLSLSLSVSLSLPRTSRVPLLPDAADLS